MLETTATNTASVVATATATAPAVRPALNRAGRTVATSAIGMARSSFTASAGRIGIRAPATKVHDATFHLELKEKCADLPADLPSLMIPDIDAPPEEGRAYREGVYRPVDEAGLPDAPDAPAFAAPGHGAPLKRLDGVPRVPRLRDVVGPSMIALGMGLGAGEFLLWPNLVATGGWDFHLG